MDDALGAVETVMRHQSEGTATNRPRLQDNAALGVYLATMRGADYDQGVFGFKTYTACSGTYRFHVYLFDVATGALLSVMEANRLGQLRTGAATGFGTSLMAREDSSVVGLFGTGYQASTQLEAVCKVRSVSSVRVFSRNRDNRNAFADDMSGRLGVEVVPVDSPKEVVDGAGIILTITSSPTPVFEGEWLQPGMHVTAAGGAHPYARELDDDAINRADVLVVDDIAQAKIECGELMIPASDGLILWDEIRELWQVVGGEILGRKTPDDVTIFKSLGMAIWDVSLAKVAYDKAVSEGVGIRL